MGCVQSKDDFNGIDRHGNKFTKMYEMGPQIGKGAFGCVVEAYKKTGDEEESYAVKIILTEADGDDPYQKKQQKMEHAKVILREHEAQACEGITSDEMDMLRKFIADMQNDLTNQTPQLPIMEIENEIKILEMCNHENIIKCFGVFRDEKKGFAVVMRRCFKSVQQSKPLFKCAQLKGMHYFKGLMSGLAYMHDINIIHRDIKPDNMMVDYQDRCFIVDFGLAHIFNEGEEATETSNLAGTVTFMSPEAWCNGQTRLGDVWAAGCVLYWLLFDQMVIKKELCPDNMTTVRGGSILMDDNESVVAKPPQELTMDRNKTMQFVEFIQQDFNARKITKESERVMDKWYTDMKDESKKLPSRHKHVKDLVMFCLHLDWKNRKSAQAILDSEEMKAVMAECGPAPVFKQDKLGNF